MTHIWHANTHVYKWSGWTGERRDIQRVVGGSEKARTKEWECKLKGFESSESSQAENI